MICRKDLIRDIKWDRENHLVTISFGKNGQGLTDEFAAIHNFVHRMSQSAYVFIENTFIDACDDVYDITLKYFYKDK